MAAVPPTSPQECRDALLERLRSRSQAAAVADGLSTQELVERLERLQPANLVSDGARLAGVWELCWSSGRQAYLSTAPWLENLQLLDPARGRAMNLLRVAGPLGQVGAIAVQARIAVEGLQRVSVRFERGGWLGPRLGERRLELLRQVQQSFPAWLDITVLDGQLRVCRGNAGTLFALLRRDDLQLDDLFGAAAPVSGEGGSALLG